MTSMIPLKRSYTLVRVYRPLHPEKKYESLVFDNDLEHEALDHFLGLLDTEKLTYEIETTGPNGSH